MIPRFFTIGELCRSDTAERLGINNTPPVELNAALIRTLSGCDRVRLFLGHAIHILSGYRSPQLNRAVGGAADSQHMRAEAVDFICPGFGSPTRVAEALAEEVQRLGIDQIILEPGWVHMSFAAEPRGEVLTMVGGKYRRGLPRDFSET